MSIMPPNSNRILSDYDHRNKKLPLAILIHHNFFFSLIYTIIVGRLSFEKWRDLDFTDSLNSSLLLPVYWVWVVVEASRLYAGQRGVLLDKVPELIALLLLSFFPQVFAVLYMGFLQESILVWDRWMNVIMMTVLCVEVGLTWRLLRSMSARETTEQKTANQIFRG
jgi:hypothetical protein